MKFSARKTAGTEARSADRKDDQDTDYVNVAWRCPLWAAVLFLAISGASLAQALYKYRGDDGEWIYSDRPPDDGKPAEIRDLPKGVDQPGVYVTHDLVGEQIRFEAVNEFHAPVEVITLGRVMR